MRKTRGLAIELSDVRDTSMGLTAGRRASATRSSRSDSMTGMQVTLTHQPTQVVVMGEVPQGNYSRETLRRLVAELRARLLDELNEAVARHLRLPGR